MRRWLAVLLLAGCSGGENAARDLASAPAAPPPRPAPVAAPTPAGDAGAVALAKPLAQAEVEMNGRVELPKGKTGAVEVWITDGPCWKAGSHSAGRAGSTNDRWGVEVFVPQGTQLYVCGRLVPKAGKASVHGEAGPFLAKGTGEVIFAGVTLKMKAGAPVDAPTPR